MQSNSGKKSDSPPPRRSRSRWIWVAVAVAALALFLLLFFGRKYLIPPTPGEKPPQAEPTPPPQTDPFFTTLREAIGMVGEGKKYYLLAQGLVAPGDIHVPSPLPSPGIEKSPYFHAALNFARAQEFFDSADKKIENVGKMDKVEVLCQEDFKQAIDKYKEATLIRKGTAQSMDAGMPSGRESQSDAEAKAKFEMAENLMASFLNKPCEGKFFQFLRSQPEKEKYLAYQALKTYYADAFEKQRSSIESQIDYHPSGEAIATPRP